jgi:hypothetical protein
VHQNKKNGLEGILRVVFVAQACAAHAEHHRSVTCDQRRKRPLGRFIAFHPASEPLEKLSVSQLGRDPVAKNRANVMQDAAILRDGHKIDLGSDSLLKHE